MLSMSHACQNKLSYRVITLSDSVQCSKMDSSGMVISLPKSNSLNETILFPTTRIQTASILTEFDEKPDL